MKMYSCMPNNSTVDFWIKNKMNVLFYGRHGVGKTSMILDGFDRNKIKYLQFSAATMDPWVDFIGVPKEIKDEKGSYLDLIRPKAFRDDEVEALFFDELNRSHKKVRNAVMELIQFKSINGKKFPHLKMIWGAVNPDDDEDAKYDVEKLDPAQSDRFHVHIEIPYKPHIPYFREKYGRTMAQSAIDWWTELPTNLKLEVSPRRLEYAIQSHICGGNLLHVLPPNTNVDKLEHLLKNGSPIRDFKELIAEGNEQKIKSWLEIENNYSAVQPEILKNPSDSLHLLSEEQICSLVNVNKVMNYIFNNPDKFMKTIEELAKNSQNKKIQSKANAAISRTKYALNITNGIAPGSMAVLKAAKNIINYRWNTVTDYKFNNKAISLYNLDPTLEKAARSAAMSKGQIKDKIRICNSIIKIIRNTTDLSKAEAKTALHLIDWVTNKTQTKSILVKTENLIQAINKCSLVIRNNDPNFNVKDFISIFPNISGKLIAKSKKVHEWCIVP